MFKFLGGLFVTLLICSQASASDNEQDSKSKTNRVGKLFSMFQIVEFPNKVCNGSDGGATSGVCYTSDECKEKGGIGSGSCAQGYGVCCVFSLGCGSRSSENVTYVESRGNEKGQCSTTICKCNDNICQFRLDFTSFSLAGPSTSTLSSGLINNNLVTGTRRRCETDTFSVVSPGAVQPPVICGENKNEHMYVDAPSDCITLNFDIRGTNSEWKVQVTQYSCDYPNLAPPGCTQYYFGNNGEGEVATYNYKGNEHLADQNQKICIRREINECRICYSIDSPSDFQLSNKEMEGVIGTSSICCGYGRDGDNSDGFDCLVIPSASQTTTETGLQKVLTFSEFCGSSVTFNGEGFDGTIVAKTICSKRVPFEIKFLSDGFEFADGDDTEQSRSQKGFRLSYKQDSKC